MDNATQVSTHNIRNLEAGLADQAMSESDHAAATQVEGKRVSHGWAQLKQMAA